MENETTPRLLTLLRAERDVARRRYKETQEHLDNRNAEIEQLENQIEELKNA